MKKENWFSRNSRIILSILGCIVVIGLCCVPFICDNWFFGEKTTIAEKLKYIGAFIGGILLTVNAYFIYKRTNELNRSNNLTAKGQLDTRFKDAATLLAQGNTSAELSGIHALHQIAIEASKTKDQKDYVKVIKDILTAFIRDNSVIEYKKDDNGKILCDKFHYFIVEKANNNKSKLVFQTIVDKLFKDDECEIYAKYPKDLSETVLIEMDFSDAKLQNVHFKGAQLQWIKFEGAQLQNVKFWNTQLQNANFTNAEFTNVEFQAIQLQDAKFSNAELEKVEFYNVLLENAKFWYARLNNVKFILAQLENVNFYKAHNIDKVLFQKNSWNNMTNFEGTAFENKTIEELTEIMGNPPTPLNE